MAKNILADLGALEKDPRAPLAHDASTAALLRKYRELKG